MGNPTADGGAHANHRSLRRANHRSLRPRQPPRPPPRRQPQRRHLSRASIPGQWMASWRPASGSRSTLSSPRSPEEPDGRLMLRTYAVRPADGWGTWEPSIPGPTLRFKRGDLFPARADQRPGHSADHTCDPTGNNSVLRVLPRSEYDRHPFAVDRIPSPKLGMMYFSFRPPLSKPTATSSISTRRTHWYHPHNSTAVQYSTAAWPAPMVEGRQRPRDRRYPRTWCLCSSSWPGAQLSAWLLKNRRATGAGQRGACVQA